MQDWALKRQEIELKRREEDLNRREEELRRRETELERQMERQSKEGARMRRLYEAGHDALERQIAALSEDNRWLEGLADKLNGELQEIKSAQLEGGEREQQLRALLGQVQGELRAAVDDFGSKMAGVRAAAEAERQQLEEALAERSAEAEAAQAHRMGTLQACDALEREVASLRVQLDDARQDCAHLSRALEALTRDTSESQAAAAHAQARVAQELASAHGRASAAERALSEAREQVLQIRARHEGELNATRAELQDQLDAVARELQVLRAKWETEIHPAVKSKYENRVKQAEAERASAEKRFQAASQEMHAMADELKAMRKQYEEALAEAQRAVTADAADAVVGVTRTANAALQVVSQALRELTPSREPSPDVFSGRGNVTLTALEGRGNLSRTRADAHETSIADAEDEAHGVVTEVERQVRELTRVAAVAQDKLTMREEQLSRANEEVEALRGQLHAAREAEQNRLSEAMKQESRSAISEEKSAVLEEQVSAMRTQMEESRNWSSRVRAERDETEHELNSAREAAAARAAELELLKSQGADAEGIRRKLEANLMQAEKQVVQFETELRAATTKIADAKLAERSLQKQLREAREQLSAQQLSGMSTRAQVDELAATLKTKEVERAHLSNERASLKAQVEDHAAKADRLRTELEVTHKQKVTLEAELKTKRAAVEQGEIAAKHFEQEVHSLKERLSEMTGALSEARDKLERAQQDLKARDNRIQELEREGAAASSALLEMRRRAEKSARDLIGAESELKRLEESLADATTRREDAETRARRATQELADAKHAATASEVKADKVVFESNVLRKELDRVKDGLAKAEAQRDNARTAVELYEKQLAVVDRAASRAAQLAKGLVAQPPGSRRGVVRVPTSDPESVDGPDGLTGERASDAFAKLEQLLSNYAERIATDSVQLREALREQSETSSKLSETRDALAKRERELETAQTELRIAVAELSDVKEDARGAKVEVTVLDQQRGDLRARNSALEKQVGSLTGDKAYLEQALAVAAADRDQTAQDNRNLKIDLEETRKARAVLEGRAARGEVELAAAARDVAAAQEAIKVLEGEVARLRGALAAREGDLAESQDRELALAAEVEGLSQQLSEARQAASRALRAAIAARNRQVTMSEDASPAENPGEGAPEGPNSLAIIPAGGATGPELVDVAAVVARAEDEFDRAAEMARASLRLAREETADVRSSLQEATGLLRAREEELRDCERQLSAARAQNDQVSEALTNLRGACESAVADNRGLKSQRDKLRDRLQVLVRERSAVGRALEHAEEELLRSLRTVEELEESKRALAEEVGRVRLDRGRAVADREEAHRALEASQQAMDQLRDELGRQTEAASRLRASLGRLQGSGGGAAPAGAAGAGLSDAAARAGGAEGAAVGELEAAGELDLVLERIQGEKVALERVARVEELVAAKAKREVARERAEAKEAARSAKREVREARHREKMAIKYAVDNSDAGRAALNAREKLLRLLREDQSVVAQQGADEESAGQTQAALRRELLGVLEREVVEARGNEDIQRARNEVLSIRAAAEGTLRAMLEEKRDQRARKLAREQG